MILFKKKKCNCILWYVLCHLSVNLSVFGMIQKSENEKEGENTDKLTNTSCN